MVVLNEQQCARIRELGPRGAIKTLVDGEGSTAVYVGDLLDTIDYLREQYAGNPYGTYWYVSATAPHNESFDSMDDAIERARKLGLSRVIETVIDDDGSVVHSNTFNFATKEWEG